MTAASAGDALNVEDVFSTYAYDGTLKGLPIKNGIAFEDGPTGAIGSSTKFENYNESFNKSSDLTGNSDGKTFTFSFWIYPTPENNNTMYIYHTSGSWKNTISWSDSGAIFVSFFANESSGGTVLEIQNPDIRCPSLTWSHVLISCDMTDAGKRHLYINDVESNASWTYTNSNIDFTRSNHAIGDDLTGSTGNFNGYMAHFFFDRTYRDFNTTSNRRYFIDDAKGSTSPSTQSALSPLIYLPMTSDYTVGQNLGSGGTFSATNSPTIVTDNGTEAEAGHGQGGMAWFKCRNVAMLHNIFDTVRGQTQRLDSAGTGGQSAQAAGRYPVFTSTGFNLGADSGGDINYSGREYCSWSFRKAPKFFDIVQYVGNGTSGHTINHNLGSKPGFIILKETSSSSAWYTYHRGLGATKTTILSNSDPASTVSNVFNDTEPTATTFTLGNNGGVNGNNQTYIAYLFAHNDGDGEFGPDGNQDIIKCGSYTGTASAISIDLGFEPQWILARNATGGSSWMILDNIRGLTNQAGGSTILYPNNYNTDFTSTAKLFGPTPTGFDTGTAFAVTPSGDTMIYVAIRRGPMGYPSSGTDFFKTITRNEVTSTELAGQGVGYYSGWPVDSAWIKGTSNTGNWSNRDRLRGDRDLRFNTKDAESTSTNFSYFDNNIGAQTGAASTQTGIRNYMWRRYPGVFDYFTYTGTGSHPQTLNHNLGVVPEMIFTKCRSGYSNGDWHIYHKDKYTSGGSFTENGGNYQWGTYYNNIDSAPTATTISVKNISYDSEASNYANYEYMVYLFASLDGIAKVGSYTGNGGTQTIDCGFTNGARFVLITRTDDSGDWHLWDSESGIVSGNDPFLELNTNLAYNSSYDSIDPDSSGFTINNTINTLINGNGNSYIFYAVA